MKFKKDKSKAPHLGRNNQRHKYKMVNGCLGCSTTVKNKGVIVDRKLKVNQYSKVVAKKPIAGRHVLTGGLHAKSPEAILLLCSVVGRGFTWSLVSSYGHPILRKI